MLDNNYNDANVADLPHVEQDVRLMRRWVKSELFKGCKFLYGGNSDLEPNGKIYNLFKEQCMHQLAGVKGNTHNFGPINQQLYLDRLWSEATKRRVIAMTLALRRSGVYTVMSNRFMGEYLALCLQV
jgi:hypothetical protein